MKKITLIIGQVLLAHFALATLPVTNADGTFTLPSRSYTTARTQTSLESLPASVAQSTNQAAADRALSVGTGPFLSTQNSFGSRSLSFSASRETMSLVSTGALLNIDFGQGYTETGFAAIGQTTNDIWNAYAFGGYDSAEMDDLVWADGTDSGISLNVWNGPGVWGNGSPDVMYNSYIYPWDGGDISVQLSNLPTGTYDVYIYGHGPSDDGNSIFDLFTDDAEYDQRGTTVWGAGWNSTDWEEGQQYVLYRNVAVSDGTLYLDVSPDAPGYSIINGIQILPSSTLVQPSATIDKILDIDFTGAGSAVKVGFAAAGQSASDIWNRYQQPWSSFGIMTNLAWGDGTNSGAGMSVENGPGVWGNGIDDAMFNSYIYTYGENVTITLTNVSLGIYDFYVYGHGPDDGNSVFQLASSTNTYAAKGTAMWGNYWNSTNWDESQQYVVYRGVLVTPDQPVVLTVFPGISGYAIINGLQMVRPFDRDGNGLPDLWELDNFGQIGVDPNGDYDNDGTSNLDEYLAGTDPNDISFRTHFADDHVASAMVSGTIEVIGGHPRQVAILVNNTNFGTAAWSGYSSSSFTAPLGSTDGRYEVWVGLKGGATNSVAKWDMIPFYLDRAAPLLVITNPIATTTSKPMLQLQGYCPEPLASL